MIAARCEKCGTIGCNSCTLLSEGYKEHIINSQGISKDTLIQVITLPSENNLPNGGLSKVKEFKVFSPCQAYDKETEMIEDNQRVKHDAGKPQFSDIPQLALLEVAKSFNYGAKKYSKFSYSEGLEWLRYYDAAQRHLHAWMLNEDMDQESGNSHLSHAIASLMMLLEAINTGQGIDNRNKLYKNK